MTEQFKTIKEHTFDHGANNFTQVSLKRTPGKAGGTFISLSVGSYTDDGERRYRKQFTVPKPLAKEIAKLIDEYADVKVESK